MVQSAIAAAGPAVAGPRIPQVVSGGQAGDRPAVAVSGPDIGCDLLELLAQVPDGRPGQGRDHPVAVVLALAAAAVVAGMRSFTAIDGWAADVPADVLAELYERGGAARAPAGPPSKATIWRVVTGADAPAADAVVGAWLMARAACGDDGGLSMPPAAGRDLAGRQEPLVQVRVDGKTVRGAKGADGSQVHLLAALAGEPGVVAAQTEVGVKTNECVWPGGHPGEMKWSGWPAGRGRRRDTGALRVRNESGAGPAGPGIVAASTNPRFG